MCNSAGYETWYEYAELGSLLKSCFRANTLMRVELLQCAYTLIAKPMSVEKTLPIDFILRMHLVHTWILHWELCNDWSDLYSQNGHEHELRFQHHNQNWPMLI